MAKTNLLDPLDIYGFDEQEPYIIAGLGAKKQVLLLGDRGSGKTWTWRRIAQSLDYAKRSKGIGRCVSRKVDAHTANQEDLVGFPFPPDDAEMKEKREKGESAQMRIVLSPNTVANAHFIVLDEATRIPRHMQNRYLGLMQERVVDGYELDTIEYIGGAANPLEYSSTEPLDEALADRWEMILDVPSFEKMSREDREKVIRAQAINITSSVPDKNAAEELHTMVEEVNDVYERFAQRGHSGVNQYVDNLARSINLALKDESSSDDDVANVEMNNSSHTMTTPLGARRIGMIYDNMLAIASYYKVTGSEGVLPDIAESVVRYTMVHQIHGDEPIPSAVLASVHDSFKDLLASQEQRILSKIEQLDHPADRVAMAMRYRTDASVVSRFIREAHEDIDDEMERCIYSYVLLNRLQSAPDKVLQSVRRTEYDRLYPDVVKLSKAADNFDILEKDVSPDMSHHDTYARLMKLANRHLTSQGRGALIIAAAALSFERSKDSVDPMNPGNQSVQEINEIITNMRGAEKYVEEYIDRFTNLSQKSFN